MASRLYKRGGIWWGAYSDLGGNHQRASLKTSDKAVAKQRLRKLELGADRGPDRTLGQALKHLLETVYAARNAHTVASYSQKARWLIQELGAKTKIGEIDRQACHEYRAKRIKDGAKPHTVYKEMVVLRLALREAGVEGVVPRVSAQYEPRERYLTLEQFRAVMSHLPERRRLWFMTACFLGARDRELARLDWRDVDMKAGVARVRGTKTKKADRYVPIAKALLPVLDKIKKDAGLVIEPWTNRRRDVTAAYWKVVGYEPPAGWSKGKNKDGKTSIRGAPRISPNDLRRTFISWLKQAGVDSLAVAQMAGTGVRMVERVYGKLNRDVYERAIAQLPEVAE